VATSGIVQELITAHANTDRQTQYQIRGILGEGGSGITYQAKIVGTDRLVALKELSLQQMTDWKALELFEREAQVLAKLDHSAIPKYIDYFAIDTPQNRSFYIVQELAPGKTLAAWLQAGWRCEEAAVKNIAIQLLQILTYLQELDPPVIHRDIKPSNILRTDDGQISLVDFGAVQQTYHNTFLRGSTVVGTFGYMAPEQFRGQSLPATDLYGLGATILTLLTNRSPAELDQDNLKINFRRKVQISDNFADWLEQILEPDTADRFKSATIALETLHKPPRKPSKSPWPKIAAIGLVGVLTVGVIDYYKFHILSLGGLTPTATFIAIWRDGSAEKVQWLLDHGVNPNAKDANGSSLLHYVVTNNRLEIAQVLIDKGADVHAHYGVDGHTVLHLAVLHPDGEMAKLLMLNKADPNAKDNFGYTPLHISILRSITPYTPDIRSYYGIRDLKNKKGSLKPIEYLLQYGADVNVIVPSTPTLHREVKKYYSGYKIFYGTARDMTVDDPVRDAILKKHGGKKLYE
jgi:serine/threonine protein kinase